jgi:hypothetical protein
MFHIEGLKSIEPITNEQQSQSTPIDHVRTAIKYISRSLNLPKDMYQKRAER